MVKKLDVALLRYITSEHFRVVTAVEMGMKNHEIVPQDIICSISNLKHGGVHKLMRDLQRWKLIATERKGNVTGFRLTVMGYDYLALRALSAKGTVFSVGNMIGVGKESDVYVVSDDDERQMAMKLARLGRTSFRQIKNKRDYHGKRRAASWLYLSRLAAIKEYAFMKALHSRKFPVPEAIACNRHVVIMELIPGFQLCQIEEIDEPTKVYDQLIALIVRLARYGLIHGDLNEFNLMITETGDITLIDFPQMVSTNHKNAEYYFDRDIRGVVDFFKRKFEFTSVERTPKFADCQRRHNLDVELAASGYSKQIEQEIEAFESEFRPTRDDDIEDEDGDTEKDETEDNGMEEDEIEEEEIETERPPVGNIASRLDTWLEGTVHSEDVEHVPEVIDGELNEEQRVEAERIIARHREMQGDREADEIADEVGELRVTDNNNFELESMSQMSQMSKLSTTSCSPAEIKNRVKKQISLRKKQERARLLKKGETSKYTATRREFSSQIKDDFWD